MRIIGIDPGKGGGIAWLDCKDGSQAIVPGAVKMPDSEVEIADRFWWLRDNVSEEDDLYAFIEAVHAMPATRQERDPMAVRNLTEQICGGKFNERVAGLLAQAGIGVSTKVVQGSVGTFTFGQGYGFLRGVLRALGIRFESVRPQDWQAVCGCRTRGDKNVSKNRAIQFFPQMPKITHMTADALLISEYGRRIGVANRRPEK